MCKDLVFGLRKDVLVITGMKSEGEVVGRDESSCLVSISVNSCLILGMNIPSNSSSKEEMVCFTSLLSNQILEVLVWRFGVD